MNCPNTILDFNRQLATGRNVTGDVSVVTREPLEFDTYVRLRIIRQNRAFRRISDILDGCSKIGITADDNIAICGGCGCILDQLNRKIDVGTLLLCNHDGSNALARTARFVGERQVHHAPFCRTLL